MPRCACHTRISRVGYPGTALTSVTMATFTDEDTTPTLSDFSATIDWGDGSEPSTGTVASGATSGFIVTGTHTYANPSVYTAKVTITKLRTELPRKQWSAYESPARLSP